VHRFTGLLGWLGVTIAASGISLTAVTLVGSSIGDPVAEPLSTEQVQARLAQAGGSASPTSRSTSDPTATASPSQTPAPDSTGVLESEGGSVVARCTDGKVWLQSWSPADGFEADVDERGPGSNAVLEFKSDDDEYRMRITCQSGRPTADVTHDDRGGNRGPGGGGDDDDDGGGGPGPG
jgi:hypothetical protein